VEDIDFGVLIILGRNASEIKEQKNIELTGGTQGIEERRCYLLIISTPG
jgi:hypothetical protein